MIASNHPLAPTHLPSSTVRIAHRTDVGCVRTVNEDSYLIYEPRDPFTHAARGKLIVLADGMGGAVGGDKASRLVVKATKEAYYDQSRDLKVSEALVEAVKRANLTVYEYGHQNEAWRGMGSTCTAAAIHGRMIHFCHVGDSRIYLVRDHRIVQLTDDHSKVSQLVRDGRLDAQRIGSHPERGVILRWLGASAEVQVDVPPHPLEMKAGDRLVICSDGLTTHVGDIEIMRLVDQRDPRQAADRLVELAKARGGSDNITVLVIQVVQVVSPVAQQFNAPIVAHESPRLWTPPSPLAGDARRGQQWRVALLALAVVLAMAAVAAWIYERLDEDPDAPQAASPAEAPPPSAEVPPAKGEGDTPSLAAQPAQSDALPAQGGAEVQGDPSEGSGADEAALAEGGGEGEEPALYPPVALGDGQFDPDIQPRKDGPVGGQVIGGRALDRALEKMNDPKSPVCAEMRKQIAEKLGISGASTEEFVQAIAAYQKRNGLDVVGHPGPQTRTKLFGFDIRRRVCSGAPVKAEQPQQMP